MRLIDADKFIETAWKKLDMNDSYIPVDIKEHVLDKMQTVDAVPVRHGKWLDYLKEGLKYKCSECESRFDRPYKYCPNCGAKMDGQEATEKNL